MPHYTPNEMLSQPVEVLLIGCGGNGSLMLTGLARLNHAITALGHPGLRVTAYDSDTVSEANMGRQLFSPADVGQYKATVLVHRINAYFGLQWRADPQMYDHEMDTNAIAISCVDSAAARSKLAANWEHDAPQYLMDLGNRAADGQVIFGETFTDRHLVPAQVDHVTLQHPYEMLPELIDITAPEDDTPSCGLAEALERQELFVNQSIATPALSILWEFFRYGRLTWHGAFVNLRTGNMRPLNVIERTA
jgi:PRTRC genetic system ThiF family protein